MEEAKQPAKGNGMSGVRCPRCGKPMKKVKGAYKYMESGLDNVILKNITLHSCACGARYPILPDILGLHKAIANTLVRKETLLTGKEIKFLRRELELRAKDLAAILGVSPVTVSRWENEAELIGLANDKLIRMFYIQKMQEECNKVFKKPIVNIKAIVARKSARPKLITITVPKKFDVCAVLDA